MFDFTNRVKKVINEYSPKEAKRLGHEFLGPEHILLGILKAHDSVAVKILQNLNISIPDLRKEIEKRCDQDGATMLAEPNAKDRIQRILDYSREEARKLRHSYIGSEHVLLAILRDNSSLPAQSLASFSVTYQVIRNELNQQLGIPQSGPINFKAQTSTKKENSKTPMLDEFARNLSKIAIEQKSDPVIGRDKEIERVVQVLSRKTKNNPILIGEAGVGKTAIVEGLAQRIAMKKVPETLFKKTIFTLDVAALIAGTKYRGEFEDRIKKIMKEVKKNDHVVLFIDEVHTIIGAGAAEGAVDAANILKPALARGEIQCIGATTLKEYKKYIEKDSALERRFQTVIVEEPNVEDTIRILSGLRKSYETHHGVNYTKESVIKAVRLSDRFITDRYLPDKAIDILDEAGASVRLKTATLPDDIKEFEKDIIRKTREKGEMVKLQNYEKAARLRDEIMQIERELDERMTAWRSEQKEKKLFIEARDIEKVISDWTGIPLQQLHETESKRLKQMEQELAERIVGQSSAITTISRAVRRARAGLKSSTRPIGSFIFLGPTGVGKTELAKALSEFMFGEESALIRFDMSEYMEMHSVSKFIGSPPGYVGYDEGGQLTEKIRRNPYSILLFDEIEKAHPEIQNILLQILDEGEITDTMGRRVDFKETIIIMTSNIGARNLLKGGKMGFDDDDTRESSKKDQVMDELKKFFNPEFINRIDEIIIFEALKREEIREIVELLIDEINSNLIEKEMHIKLSNAAKDYLGNKGYSDKYGARPLKRLVQKEIEDEIASMVIDQEIELPGLIRIGVKNNKLTFKTAKLGQEKLEELKAEYLVDEQSIDQYWEEGEEFAEMQKQQKAQIMAKDDSSYLAST